MKKIAKFILKGILRLLGSLPLKVHYRLARFLAWLAGDVLRYRRDVVMTNISRCFPEKNYWELAGIRKGFYQHFGEVVAEAIWFGACRNPKRLRDAHIVEMKNPEELSRLAEVSPSCMILFSHTGNWELIGGIENYIPAGAMPPITEENVCVVYRKLSSKIWDEIMNENRTAPLKARSEFKGYLETEKIVRYIYEHKDEMKFYNLCTDQRPYFESAGYITLDFFGQPVRIMAGGAAVAHKFHMSVTYLKMHRVSQGHYTYEYITICDDASQMSVEDIMRKYYDLVEQEIKEQPENYLWSHHRFA
ncbi:MAG: hypothetical protein MJY83_04405 [Bacteroidales bacterium]|nr:hypothetical protein [Bacteroidales bacterium]